MCGVGSVLTDLPQFRASRMSEFLVSIALILFPLSAESVLCLIIFQVSCKSYERNCVVSMNLILYPTYKGRIMFVFCCRPRMRPDVCRVGSVPHDFQGFFQFL